MTFDFVIIGGGAAGMMAAITAAGNGKKTCIIEHTDRVGKKILQTGNGKCNLTNLDIKKEGYLCDDADFVMGVYGHFGTEQTLEFFKKLGVFTKSKNGYVYPNSEQASTVLDALRAEADNLKITLMTDTEVKDIRKNKDIFEIDVIDKNSGKKSNLSSEKVVIATGSKAAPKTGSDGSGYKLASKLGHDVIKPLPALVQLKSDLSYCKGISGVRSEGKVTLYVDGKVAASDTGEVQYTDYGISGIPVFQISRFAVRAHDSGRKVKVIIDMLPSITEAGLVSMLSGGLVHNGYKTLEQYISGILNRKLACAVIKRAGFNVNDTVSHDAKNYKRLFEKIASVIKGFEVPITGFNSFENGQVCSGGIPTKQIDNATMESKLVKGLYFAGEIVDVDGICGGYNLQWAWSSGYLAGTQ